MKQLGKIAGIVGLAGSILSSCNVSESELETKVRAVLNPGQAKVIVLKVSSDVSLSFFGPEIRFYDNDGDGKTVEQYVEIFGSPYISKIDLIRPGVEKVHFDPNNGYRIRREMTKKNMDELDREYQTLLGKF